MSRFADQIRNRRNVGFMYGLLVTALAVALSVVLVAAPTKTVTVTKRVPRVLKLENGLPLAVLVNRLGEPVTVADSGEKLPDGRSLVCGLWQGRGDPAEWLAQVCWPQAAA